MKSIFPCFIVAAALLLGGCNGRGAAPAQAQDHDHATA